MVARLLRGSFRSFGCSLEAGRSVSGPLCNALVSAARHTRNKRKASLARGSERVARAAKHSVHVLRSSWDLTRRRQIRSRHAREKPVGDLTHSTAPPLQGADPRREGEEGEERGGKTSSCLLEPHYPLRGT
eukprot:2892531-Rhodomonas_salina.3